MRGLPGKNIPLDLHREHLSRLAKGAIRNLGSNKTSVRAVTRFGQAIGTLSPLLDQFDTESAVNVGSSKYRKVISIYTGHCYRCIRTRYSQNILRNTRQKTSPVP